MTTRIRNSTISGILALLRAAGTLFPADARYPRDGAHAAVEPRELTLPLTLNIVGRARQDRFARERIASEAALTPRQLRVPHHRLRLRLEAPDEGLALAERAVGDPAGQQGGGEADQEFQPARHGLPITAPQRLVSPSGAPLRASRCR